MNRLKCVSTFLILFLLGTSIIGVAQSNPELYNSLTKLGPKSKYFFKKNNIQNVVTVSSRYFAPNKNSLSLDFSLFSASIKKWFPYANSHGIAALDWEGIMTRSLFKNRNSTDFKLALANYTKILQYAKRIRPNVRWGCYGLPFTTYGNLNSDWRQRNLSLMPLLKECDILFPSLYISIQSSGNQDINVDIDYAQYAMLECLQLGSMVNKPILPYIWKRYNNRGKISGFQLIPKDELSNFIRSILKTSYSGKKAIGIVWWGADIDFYNERKSPLITEFRLSGKKDFHEYDDNLIVDYGKVILGAVKSVN